MYNFIRDVEKSVSFSVDDGISEGREKETDASVEGEEELAVVTGERRTITV